MIQAIIENWKEIAVVGAAAVSGAIHGYQIVVQAGGLKNICGKFINGEKPSETPTIPAKQPEPKPPGA